MTRHRRRRRRHARENPLKRPMVLVGLLGVGALAAYYFWQKKSAAAAIGPAPSPALPAPKPVISQPKPSGIQVTPVHNVVAAGNNITLLGPLRINLSFLGQASGGYLGAVTIPGGTTLHIDRVEGDGTMFFQYNGQSLSSPVEDYTSVV